MPDDIEQHLEKLMAENAAMEKEIMALTKGSTMGSAAATKSLAKENAGRGIKVMHFGNAAISDDAGVDNGSSWRPSQCSRRTTLGGFFTS